MPNLIRLQRALEIMENLEDAEVDMSHVMVKTGPCGSCGCIVGHALTDRETYPDIEFVVVGRWGDFYVEGAYVGDACEYEFIAMRMFDVTREDAEMLFSPVSLAFWLDRLLLVEYGGRELPPQRTVAIARLKFAIDRYSRGTAPAARRSLTWLTSNASSTPAT